MTYREDIEGLDASILMHPKVWEASGHVENFTDPMIDCKQCKSRFRLDVLGDSFNEKKKKKAIDSLKQRLNDSEELIIKLNGIYENPGDEDPFHLLPVVIHSIFFESLYIRHIELLLMLLESF